MIAQNTLVETEVSGPQVGILDYTADFPAYANQDIEVEVEHTNGAVTALVLNTDYTLTDVAVPNTNVTVNLIDASQAWIDAGGLHADYTLRIKFTQKAYQDSKFRDFGRIAPQVLDKVLDRLTLFVLAVKKNVDSIVIDLQDQLDDHEQRIVDLETVNSFVAPTISHESSNFTADYDKIHVIDANLDVQLPAPVNGKNIKLKSSGVFTINIVRAGSEKIDNVALDYVLDSDLEAVTLTTDGTDWYLI